VGQVLFRLVLAAAFSDQAVLTPDAFQSAVAEGQVELADQAASAEGGQNLAQLDQLGFEGRGSFERLMMAGARLLGEARRAVLLETAQPLTDRRPRSFQQQLHLPPPLFTQAFQPRQGYTM
jgi:hypothetical protein